MRIEAVSYDPLVLLVHDFVTDGECVSLIDAAENAMPKRSTITCADPKGCIDQSRTSYSAHLTSCLVCAPIQERAKRFAQLDRCETLQVVRYHPGQEFRPHLDAFNTEHEGGRREVRTGGQRAATFLVYLNEPEEGGSTDFPTLGLSVQPRKRAALYWRHQTADGRLDSRVLHAGAPVRRGTKYAANIWLRHPPASAQRHQLNPQLSPRGA